MESLGPSCGIGRGELFSLSVAPAGLPICLYLLWTGAGALALDRRIPGCGER